MRPLSVLLLSCLAFACGEAPRTVQGSLLPGGEVTDVYVVGQPLRSRVEADSFLVTGIDGELVELEFVGDGERLGRMRLEKWAGPTLDLRGIWLEDGIAFATSLRGEGAATVNGLRMVAAEALPRSVATEGVVLAVARGGDALILRPADPQLPDLRVVVTPGTAREPAPGDEELSLDVGDRVAVEGTTESGYLVATRLSARPAAETTVTPRDDDEERSESRREEEERDRPGSSEEEDRGAEASGEGSSDGNGPGSLVRPGGGRGRGRGLQRRD